VGKNEISRGAFPKPVGEAGGAKRRTLHQGVAVNIYRKEEGRKVPPLETKKGEGAHPKHRGVLQLTITKNKRGGEGGKFSGAGGRGGVRGKKNLPIVRGTISEMECKGDRGRYEEEGGSRRQIAGRMFHVRYEFCRSYGE